MPLVGMYGDPCWRCREERPNSRRIQRATHWGLCARHWFGATAIERRLALIDAENDPPDPLEALWRLPSIDPRRVA